MVNTDARGFGVGQATCPCRRLRARARARSLTLHVFSNNHRARSLYDNFDFDSELIRAVKWL